jgi:hypothetical protein
MWTKLTIELGNIDPLTLQKRVEDANCIVKAIMTNKKTNRNHSIWYKFETHKDWENNTHSQDYIVLLPRVKSRTVEIYKDLGYNLVQMGNMSRQTRRMHFRQLK